MNNYDPSDVDLQAKFQLLRDQELEAAPSYRNTIAMANRLTSRTHSRSFPLLVPIAAVVLFALISGLIFLKPEAPSLSETLPILLRPTSYPSTLFAEMATRNLMGSLPSDEFLPFHFRIHL